MVATHSAAEPRNELKDFGLKVVRYNANVGGFYFNS